jgi:hypothetical protein
MRAVGAIAIVLATPAIARADVGLVVVPARAAPAGEAALGDAVAAALGSARRRPLDDARAARAAGAVRAESLAAFARVRELVDEGWRAYQQVQTEFAVSRLGEARRQAEALLPLDGGAALYADAALRLGAALDNAGRRDEADDVLRLAAALDPTRTVTVQEFSPDVVAAHDRAVAASRAMRAVTLTASPAAVVEIDGTAVGTTPVAVELAVGQHVVVARAAGHAPLARTLAVGDSALEVTLALDPDRDALGLSAGVIAGDEASRALAVDAAIAYAELDALVLTASVWRGGRPALLVQWCDGAPASCTGVVEIGYDEGGLEAAARAAIDEARALARTGRRWGPTLPGDPRVARGERPGGGGGERCRWCRPALYAGAGVVAAALVTAIVLLAGGDDGTTVGIDPDDFVP